MMFYPRTCITKPHCGKDIEAFLELLDTKIM